MELDLEGQHADRAYALLSSLVTPRPIAWVTTLSPDGVVNAAPFSFFNVLGANPPILGFCPGDRADGTPKDTARNIQLTHEFVVNLVDEKVAEAMMAGGIGWLSARKGNGTRKLSQEWTRRCRSRVKSGEMDLESTSVGAGLILIARRPTSVARRLMSVRGRLLGVNGGFIGVLR